MHKLFHFLSVIMVNWSQDKQSESPVDKRTKESYGIVFFSLQLGLI